MKVEVMMKILNWLEEGYTAKRIADTYGINPPDIIDMIVLIRNSEVDLEVY